MNTKESIDKLDRLRQFNLYIFHRAMAASLFRRKIAAARRPPFKTLAVATLCAYALWVSLAVPGKRTSSIGRGVAVQVASIGDATGLTRVRLNENEEKEIPALAKRFGLNRVDLEAIAHKGYIHVTFANHHFLDFVLNWVEHLEALNATNFLVGSMDDEILRELRERLIPTVNMSAGVSLDSMVWGTPEFKRANNIGVKLNLAVLELGFSVIAADVDTVWMKDPVEFFERYPRADMLFSSDGSFSTHKDGGLEDYQGRDPPNSGLYLLRPSAENFTRAWVEATEAGEAVWENQALWDLFFQDVKYIPEDPDRLSVVYNGTLHTGVLPVTTFAHTFTFFSQHLHEKLGLEPYVVHTTHQFAGLTGKRHRLRETLLWNDPPEYYDPPNGFIMWEVDLPEDMLRNSAPRDLNTANFNDTEGHFVLVHHQLSQMRQALAIAKSLNRILIMSEFWCGHDRSVWPHPGAVYGTQNMSLPFICPLNQVLDLDVMKPEKRPGSNDPSLDPYIDFRESSFLRNPRLPASVKRSKLRVEVCNSDDNDCEDGSHSAHIATGPFGKDPVVRLSRNLTDGQIRSVFQHATHFRILDFSSMVDMFGGFEDPSLAQDFEEHLKVWTGIYCCSDQGLPLPGNGHVYYDFFSDVHPHTDRFGHVFNDTHPWYPLNGL